MNNFIERIDARLRMRSEMQEQLECPVPRNATAVDSTALRQKATQLLEEAATNRDKATCVRGPKQASLLKIAGIREQEAGRLLALAAEQSTTGNATPCGEREHLNTAPFGTTQLPPSPVESSPMSLRDVGSNAPFSECCNQEISRSTSSTETQLVDDHCQRRAHAMLRDAADKRDKASCVKGGKQRALLTVAERLEAQAEGLLNGSSDERSVQSCMPTAPAGNYNIPNGLGIESPSRRGGDSFGYSRRQDSMGEILAGGPSLPSPTGSKLVMDSTSSAETLVANANKLREEAVVLRDKATCVSGAKQRQILNLVEIKETKAAQFMEQAAALAQRLGHGGLPATPELIVNDSSSRLPIGMNHGAFEQTAAGQMKNRPDPRGHSGIFM